MIKETEHFILEPIATGYQISRKLIGEPPVKMIEVTLDTKFQDYIIDWDLYCEYIKLIDEAIDALKQESLEVKA